jgi:hypothetical protein
MKFCRLLCIIASIEYIRRQIEESFTSCIKGLIRKFTDIHILTIQSGVNKRNKNRGEHSVIKHQFSIHSYIPVIKKYHGNQMYRLYTTKHIPLFPSKHHENLTNALKTFCLCALCFLKLFPGKRCPGLFFVQIYAHWVNDWSPISNAYQLWLKCFCGMFEVTIVKIQIPCHPKS